MLFFKRLVSPLLEFFVPPPLSSSGPRILVVDDAPANIRLMRLILGEGDYRVLEAASGRQALELIRAEPPDAVLLDVTMPEMSGYEVCAAVRGDPRLATLPVLLVTGLSQPEDWERGVAAGATDFICKPFGRRELLMRLRAALSSADAGNRSALIPALPGNLMLTNLSWNVLGLSAGAVALLGLVRPAVGALNLAGLLDPENFAALGAGAAFSFMMGGRSVTGLPLTVSEPGGLAVMRVISLRDAHESGG